MVVVVVVVILRAAMEAQHRLVILDKVSDNISACVECVSDTD